MDDKVPVFVLPTTVNPLFNVVASATNKVLLIVAAPVNVVAPATDKVPVLVLFVTIKLSPIEATPVALNVPVFVLPLTVNPLLMW